MTEKDECFFFPNENYMAYCKNTGKWFEVKESEINHVGPLGIGKCFKAFEDYLCMATFFESERYFNEGFILFEKSEYEKIINK